MNLRDTLALSLLSNIIAASPVRYLHESGDDPTLFGQLRVSMCKSAYEMADCMLMARNESFTGYE